MCFSLLTAQKHCTNNSSTQLLTRWRGKKQTNKKKSATIQVRNKICDWCANKAQGKQNWELVSYTNKALFLSVLSGLLKPNRLRRADWPEWRERFLLSFNVISQNIQQTIIMTFMMICIDVHQQSSSASAPLCPPQLHRWSIRKLMRRSSPRRTATTGPKV